MENNKINNLVSLFPYLVLIAVAPNIFYRGSTIAKLAILVFFAVFMLLVLIYSSKQIIAYRNKSIYFIIILLLLGGVLSTLESEAPIEISFFGSDKRFGLLAVICYSLIFLGFLILSNFQTQIKVFNFLVYGNFTVLAYGYLQLFKLDPFKWSSGSMNLFSTLGNSNYASAFVAMSYIPSIYFFYRRGSSNRFYSYIFVTLITIPFLALNGSSQGLIIFFIQINLILLLVLKNSAKKFWLFCHLAFLSLSILLVTAGMFNFGPLKKYIFSDSLESRSDFFRAAVSMFKSNPIYGVGPDSYGDFYGAHRTSISYSRNYLERADSAHNYILDIFSMYGLISGLAFLLLNILVITKIFRLTKGSLDYFNLSVYVAWISIFLQSLISPISIPLMLYFFIFSAFILNFNSEAILDSKAKKDKVFKINRNVSLFLVLSFIVSTLLVGPTLRKDSQLLKALNSGDTVILQRSLEMSPLSTSDFQVATKNLRANGLYDLELQIAVAALKFNPRDLVNLSTIILNPKADPLQRTQALLSYLELDPFNPDALRLKEEISNS